MKRVKRLSIWLVSSVGILLAAAVISLVLAQKYVSREQVKKEIVEYLSSRTSGDFEFESVDFQFLHKPRVSIKKGSFSLPGVRGTFDSLVVYPRILPLLTGKVDIRSIELAGPVVSVSIPETAPETPGPAGHAGTIGIVRNKVARALEYLKSHEKGLRGVIKNGRVDFTRSGRMELSLTGLNAAVDLPDDTLKIRLSGRSRLWDRLVLNAWMDVDNLEGSGDLTIDGLKPHLVSDYFLPDGGLISDSSVNLLINYTTEGLEAINLKLKSHIPRLTVTRHGGKFDVSVKSVDAGAYLDENEVSVNLNRAELTSPGMVVKGMYRSDRAVGKSSLSLSGENVDVDSAREAALVAAGENDVVDAIFEVVRGGTVPAITLEAGGVSFKDLWRQGNFTIKGSMVGGNIYIPVAEFDIVEASGDAVISDGLLEGTNLSGRLGNSTGSDGALRIGLEGPQGALSLDIAVEADPAEIPPVISQFVHDEAVRKELSLIKNVSGKAAGRLVLGESKKSPEAEIHVSGFDITADYGRFPYPVNVRGGDFRLAGKVMDVRGLNLTGGGSASSDISGTLELGESGRLGVKAGRTELDLGEIYSWLKTFDELAPHLEHMGILSGAARFPSVSVTGPVTSVGLWSITAEGEVSGVAVRLRHSNENLAISEAEVTSADGRLTLSNAVVTSGRSSVSIDMVLKDYFTDILSMKLDFGGTLEPDAMRVLSEYVPLPSELVFPGPLSVSESTLELRTRPDGPGAPAGPQAESVSPVWSLDVNVKTDALEWRDSENETQAPDSPPEDKKWSSPVGGSVNVSSGRVRFMDFDWDSVDAVVSFFEHGFDIDIGRASLCGISTPGLVNVGAPGIKFEFKPSTENEELSRVISCLLDKAGIISGDLDLNAVVQSTETGGGFLSALQGGVDLISTDGRVEKYGGLARFFAILNFGDLFRGQGPDFTKEGFSYDRLTAKAGISEGKIMIEEALMEGPSMKVAGKGVIDLTDSKLDIEILVIPVLAVDSVIEKIPLINFLLGSEAVSIPIRVRGDISNPEITQISPYALRFGLLGIIKQMLNIPATIIKPMKNGEEAADDSGRNAPSTPVQNPQAGAMPGLENK